MVVCNDCTKILLWESLPRLSEASRVVESSEPSDPYPPYPDIRTSVVNPSASSRCEVRGAMCDANRLGCQRLLQLCTLGWQSQKHREEQKTLNNLSILYIKFIKHILTFKHLNTAQIHSVQRCPEMSRILLQFRIQVSPELKLHRRFQDAKHTQISLVSLDFFSVFWVFCPSCSCHLSFIFSVWPTQCSVFTSSSRLGNGKSRLSWQANWEFQNYKCKAMAKCQNTK